LVDKFKLVAPGVFIISNMGHDHSAIIMKTLLF
jgi:hypothetical protein